MVSCWVLGSNNVVGIWYVVILSEWRGFLFPQAKFFLNHDNTKQTKLFILTKSKSWVHNFFDPTLLKYETYNTNPQKMAQKNTMLFLAPMGKTGLSHDIFFQIFSWAFRGRWGRMTSDGEILRLRPRNFAIIHETLAPQKIPFFPWMLFFGG